MNIWQLWSNRCWTCSPSIKNWKTSQSFLDHCKFPRFSSINYCIYFFPNKHVNYHLLFLICMWAANSFLFLRFCAHFLLTFLWHFPFIANTFLFLMQTKLTIILLHSKSPTYEWVPFWEHVSKSNKVSQGTQHNRLYSTVL